MRKNVLVVVMLMLSIFMCSNVYAVDYNDTTCNYNSKAHLNKLAYNVTASYEFKRAEDGKISFDISIYNIVDDIYVTYRNKDLKEDVGTNVIPSMTKNGVYTFNVPDTENIITYEIVVRTLKFGCIDDIRKFTLVKPKRNSYYDLDICKYDEVVDYLYCKEWITQDLGLSDAEIKEKIKAKRNKKTITTTECVSCMVEVRNKAKKAKFESIKEYIVIGLSIGIAIDIILVYFMVSNIRRSEI